MATYVWLCAGILTAAAAQLLGLVWSADDTKTKAAAAIFTGLGLFFIWLAQQTWTQQRTAPVQLRLVVDPKTQQLKIQNYGRADAAIVEVFSTLYEIETIGPEKTADGNITFNL